MNENTRHCKRAEINTQRWSPRQQGSRVAHDSMQHTQSPLSQPGALHTPWIRRRIAGPRCLHDGSRPVQRSLCFGSIAHHSGAPAVRTRVLNGGVGRSRSIPNRRPPLGLHTRLLRLHLPEAQGFRCGVPLYCQVAQGWSQGGASVQWQCRRQRRGWW